VRSLNPTRGPGPDDDVVARILRGVAVDDDALSDYRHVVELVQSLQDQPGPSELALEEEMVAAAAAVLAPPPRRGSASRSARRRRHAGRHPAGRRVAVAALAAATGCLLSGSLALAGALPDGLQRPLAHALSRVGITIPAPAAARPGTTTPDAGRGRRAPSACGSRHCPAHGARGAQTPSVGLQQPAPQAPTTLGSTPPTTPGTHPQVPDVTPPQPPGQLPPVPSSVVPRQADRVPRLLADPASAADLARQ